LAVDNFSTRGVISLVTGWRLVWGRVTCIFSIGALSNGHGGCRDGMLAISHEKKQMELVTEYCDQLGTDDEHNVGVNRQNAPPSGEAKVLLRQTTTTL
jgi:hypothetical protein